MVAALGRPAWAGTAHHTDYGGHEEKANWFARGTTNPQSDVGAAAIMRQADDVAAWVRGAPFAALQYTNNDTGTAAPTINACLMQTGVNVAGYEGDAAPTGFPSGVRNGNGDCTFTFATSYADAYGTSEDLNLRHVVVTVQDDGGPYEAVWQLVNAYTVRVRCYNANTGAALQDVDVSLWVK